MITGYNTDVRHNDLELHVQTEDKGTSNPFIESLIYVGGQVLAAKRTSYADVLAEGRGEKAVVEMMDKQHRAMIAAIRAGKFDDKLSALMDASNGDQKETQKAVPPTEASTEALLAPDEDGGSERTLDEVILEYLTAEAQQDHLILSLDDDVELAFGQSTSLVVRTGSSKSGLPIPGAEVTIKMISTVGEPCVLGNGTTDDQGALELNLQIPELAQGTAALIITASSSIGKAEHKYLL